MFHRILHQHLIISSFVNIGELDVSNMTTALPGESQLRVTLPTRFQPRLDLSTGCSRPTQDQAFNIDPEETLCVLVGVQG